MSVAIERSNKELREQAEKWLKLLIASGIVAITTATLTYAYPETLAAIRRPMLLIHDLSGDLSIVALIGYLVVHLRRVWKIKHQTDSRWSGYLAVALWSIAGLTGIYGQIWPLERGSTAYLLHLATAITLIGASGIHGGLGYRRRLRAAASEAEPREPAA